MELVFRKLPPVESVKPQPGEVYLVPAALDQRSRHDLASFMLEQGTAALLHGPGTPERLIIDSDPKFDDMLAALFVQRQFLNEPLPPGCKEFATYAALCAKDCGPRRSRFK